VRRRIDIAVECRQYRHACGHGITVGVSVGVSDGGRVARSDSRHEA
jgi:hypothetical protein